MLHCPALTALRVISGKWKTRILWRLREGASHFGALHDALPGVSAKVLTQQLRQMEADGLIERSVSMRGGVAHAFYGFTAFGRTLIPALDALGDWGLTHGNAAAQDPQAAQIGANAHMEPTRAAKGRP